MSYDFDFISTGLFNNPGMDSSYTEASFNDNIFPVLKPHWKMHSHR